MSFALSRSRAWRYKLELVYIYCNIISGMAESLVVTLGWQPSHWAMGGDWKRA
jgi:23S rRNA U2552 (ribose-2'-O)-methylase RlmE/FtsJ